MPAPYSDNMYSEDSGQGGRDDALSPTDGYFHASEALDTASPTPAGTNPQQHNDEQRTSSNVPAVPDVLVEDPTLHDKRAAKAAEAERERLLNTEQRNDTSPHSTSSSQAHASAGTSSHQHRRSVEEDSSLEFGQSTRQDSSHTPSHTSAAAASSTGSATPATQTHHQEQDAPPAYSPTPSSPPSAVPQHGYQTFNATSAGNVTNPHSNNSNFVNGNDPNVNQGDMGVPEEEQSLLPRHPQSMGGHPDGKPPTQWQRIKDTAGTPSIRKKIKTLLGVAVVISILIAIFGTVNFSSDRHHKVKTPKVIDRDPIAPPTHGDDSNMEWRSDGNCRNTPHRFDTISANLIFDSSHGINIEQRPERDGWHNGRQPHVRGQLIIRPAVDSKSGKIDIEIMTNDERLKPEAKVNDGSDQRISVITPRALDWWPANDQSPCVQVRITLYVPSGADLDALEASVVQLDVSVLKGIDLGVLSRVNLSTVSGDVQVPSANDIESEVAPYALKSRQITVSTVSGNISGWFPLYDLLKINSVSGDVQVQVAPKPADEKSAKSATLDVETISGEIKIEEPLRDATRTGKKSKKLPERDYVVKVDTKSGRINANVAMTRRATFETISGDILLDLQPFITDSKHFENALTTQTKSGNTKLTLHEPIVISDNGDDKEALEVRSKGSLLNNLRSRHASISGDVLLDYPQAWEGQFKASSLSGDISIAGKDVKITKSSGPIIRNVEGYKGNGDSHIKMDTMSGDLKLTIGDKK